MKLNKKAGLLTGGMLMLGAFYGQHASADMIFPLGTISALSSYTTTDSGINGAFTDTVTFDVTGDAFLNNTEESLGLTGFVSQGVDLKSVKLFDGATLIATGNLSTIVNTVSSLNPALVVTLYSDVLTNISLIGADHYTLEIKGDYLGFVGGSYNGTLTLTPAGVPLPAAAWLFLSAAIGFLGLNRRK